MRPSSVGGGRILRCILSVRLSVCLSVRLSVCPSVPLSSVTSRHLANYNDTLRAAYRTAISAAQTCFVLYFCVFSVYVANKRLHNIVVGCTNRNIPTNKRNGSWLVRQLVAYSQLVDAKRQKDRHSCNSHFTANVHSDFQTEKKLSVKIDERNKL